MPSTATRDRYIRVTAQTEGLHRWPDAPAPDGYLRHQHRHLFVVNIRIQVHHHDREIEINAFTRWLQDEALPALADPPQPGHPLDFGHQSCEQLAERITHAITARFGPGRWMECEVLEDGILGGGVRCTA